MKHLDTTATAAAATVANAICLQTILIYRNIMLSCVVCPFGLSPWKQIEISTLATILDLFYNPGNIIPKNYIYHFECILLSYRIVSVH